MKTTILITGTSRGIGKALALHFLSQGATVIGSSRKTQSELALLFLGSIRFIKHNSLFNGFRRKLAHFLRSYLKRVDTRN